MPDLERRHRERVKQLNREVACAQRARCCEELRRRYADLPEVLAHLDAVQADVVENVHEFLSGLEGRRDRRPRSASSSPTRPVLRRYVVNVMVDHAGRKGAPVVYEDLPTLANLVGRVEHHAHFGTLVTDFTLVRPGALHRANGGYLVLDARKLLVQPFAWDELKRALRAREIRIESPERLLGITSTRRSSRSRSRSHVKVVLVGDRSSVPALVVLDPDFPQLFKIEADFEDEIPRSPDADRDFARLVATLARRDGLPPFDRAAVERVLHEASRLAEDSTRDHHRRRRDPRPAAGGGPPRGRSGGRPVVSAARRARRGRRPGAARGPGTRAGARGAPARHARRRDARRTRRDR